MLFKITRAKINKKTKRHSGWKTPITTLEISKKKIIAQCLEPQIYYDDWEDYRDGFRKRRRAKQNSPRNR